MPLWMPPMSNARTIAMGNFSSAGTNARALKSAMEMALVGPLMSCREESKRAPTAVITMAVYSPYCGGRPAMLAYAIACGTATAATVRPATPSSRKDRQL